MDSGTGSNEYVKENMRVLCYSALYSFFFKYLDRKQYITGPGIWFLVVFTAWFFSIRRGVAVRIESWSVRSNIFFSHHIWNHDPQ